LEGNADEQASRNTRASGRNGDARFRATSGPASPDDQREFDKYYTKRVNDARKSDRDDIAKDVKHMQELMVGTASRPTCIMRRSPVRAMNIQPHLSTLAKFGLP